MGSDRGGDDEAPAHSVTVAPFAMDRYEIIQENYEGLMLADPAHFKGARNPVEQVRWSDAAEYCNLRSLEEGLEPAYDDVTYECNFDASGYRLPTEAEWEFACRAGSDTKYGFGDSERKLKAHAVYAESSGGRTHSVGSKKPNAWGFFDLHGNVAEWCNDRYGADYYGESPAENPRGPAEGDKRVLRGGAWASTAESARASYRMYGDPGITDACFAKDTYGFRCVRRLAESEMGQASE